MKHSNIKSVEITQDMVDRNYKELIKKIRNYKNEKNLHFKKDEPLIAEYHIEINRMLHNYLASVYTLIEHTRILRNKFQNDEFEKQFIKKFSRLLNDEIYHLYKNLRTCCQHVDVPPTSIGLKFYSLKNLVSQENIFSIDTESLLEWSNLPDDVIGFIEEQDKDIDVKETLEDFHFCLMKFNKWIINTIQSGIY